MSGIALKILAVFAITAMSAVIHGVSGQMPLGQLILGRSVFAIPVIVIYMAVQGTFPAALRTTHPRLHVRRNLFGVASMAMSFLSLSYLPVANAEALAYLTPVFSLALAAIILKERLTLHAIGAVALGFAGVLMMVAAALRMPGEGALIGVVAGLGFASTSAFVRVHVKAMTATERPSTIAFYFAVTGTVIGAGSLALARAPLGAGALGALALAGCLGAVAHIAAAEALKREAVTRLAPLEFTGLIWAVGFDVVLFRTWPGPWGWAGLTAILGAAVLVSLRGRRPIPRR